MRLRRCEGAPELRHAVQGADSVPKKAPAFRLGRRGLLLLEPSEPTSRREQRGDPGSRAAEKVPVRAPALVHSSQRETSFDPTARFGENGLIVPAVTICPAASFTRANFFASASFSNLSVDRATVLFDVRSALGTLYETYHVYLEIGGIFF